MDPIESRTEKAIEHAVKCREILVAGIVQGVGFRPFIYRIAKMHGLAGTVCNTSEGVKIVLEGGDGQIAAFLKSFHDELPPLATVTSFKTTEGTPRHLSGFTILPSTDETAHEALVPPDVAVCDNCMRELHDPADRRHRYPFINCTDCGPRYTIIVDVPYDRPQTAMVEFPMCPACRREYDDPANRRFHAEATCCPVCGPRLRLLDALRNEIAAGDPIAFVQQRLSEGRIAAIKGIGGFHLAVDAANAHAVEQLRRRKGRGLKPFALMAASLAKIKIFCIVDEAEEKMLTSPARPIVILRKRPGDLLAPGLAPHNNYLGVMLPYAPLHSLLLACPFTALVMTSANLVDEPIVIDDNAAFDKLGGVADFFLTHNRRILYRTDDSIVKAAGGRVQTWRRSRGYVPRPITAARPAPPILACGALMKGAIALTRGRDIFVSQHLGDVDTREGLAFFEETIEHLQRMLGVKPEAIVHDLHPEYLSTRYALASPVARKIGVQHHFAHVASCQCEHELAGRDVIGFALDGTGYGLDGHVWGGEVLVGRPPGYARAAHVEYVPMPGGELAIRQPWRMAVSHLTNAMGRDYRALPLPFIARHADVLDDIETMALRRINSPLTSSCGRLFDAVAAMLGLGDQATFEGEPAVRLEMAAAVGDAPPYAWDLTDSAGQPSVIGTKKIFRGIAKDLAAGAAPAAIAWRFHLTLVEIFSTLAVRLRKERGINAVAFGGGVFLNSILAARLAAELTGLGFEVYQPERVPPGDGGICLGQIAIARALLE